MTPIQRLRADLVRRLLLITALVAAISVIHFLAPSGTTTRWTWLHIAAQKFYYLPILLAAAWFRRSGMSAVTLVICLLYLIHVVLDWEEHPVVQVRLGVEIANYWIVGLTASVLIGRERQRRREVARAHEETLEALASSLEMREQDTGLHSQRIRDYALLLADRMDLPGEEVDRRSLATGALLHDIGKIGITDGVLLKPAALDSAERTEIRRHPELGSSLMGSLGFLQGARDIVLNHHERYDGTGYPRGIAGGAIPLGARILAVADVFDAITTKRPYKEAFSYREAAEYILRSNGTHFDPQVVEAFRSVPFEDWAEIAERTGIRLRREPQEGVPVCTGPEFPPTGDRTSQVP